MSESIFDSGAYADALQTFIINMEQIHTMDSNKLADTMGLLAGFLRLSRAEAVIYDDIIAEQRGNGNTIVFFDDNRSGHEPSYTKRNILTPGRVVYYSFYVRCGEAGWNEKEQNRLDVLINLLNTFIRRMLMKQSGQYHATHEQDFGLYNIPYIVGKLTEYSKRHILGEFAACYFNIRRLSFINETLGREQGTRLLGCFLNGLQDLLTDKREILARFGGDNFIVFFLKDHMDAVLSYLGGTDIALEDSRKQSVTISAWMGVYPLTDPEDTPDNIMDAVTFAVNTAKRTMSETPVFFTEEIKTRFNERKRILFMFADAIKKEEFSVYYQPKVHTRDYTLAGAEALCRWMHDGQMIMPGAFIPALEQSDRICQLDFYMLEHACRDIRRWLDNGREAVCVSVNLSRRHFADKNLSEHILEIIDRNHVPHKYIEIELTETSVDVGFKDLKKLIEKLKQEGIRTAVDDFGTGYSSLNLIRELPWDVLKLDKSFINVKEHDSRKAQMMFSHIIALAHELGMECITEGVESLEQISILKENNCYMAQGFWVCQVKCVSFFEFLLVAGLLFRPPIFFDYHHLFNENGEPESIILIS